MRKFSTLSALLLGSTLMASAVSQAADNGIYIGAGIGQANVDIDAGITRIDGDDTGFKVIAGFRPLDFFGVEANYIDFGEVSDSGFNVESDALTAYAVGFLPLGPVDLFAKAGLVSSDTSVRTSLGEVSEDGEDFAYGAGLQFRLLSLSARIEYEVFDVDGVDDLNMISLGLTYTFL